MPKIRTRKGLADRIKVSSKGKLVRSHAWKSHLQAHKSPKRERAFRQDQAVHKSDVRNVRRALGI